MENFLMKKRYHNYCKNCNRVCPKGRNKFCSDKCSKDFFIEDTNNIKKLFVKKCLRCQKKLPKLRSKFCSLKCNEQFAYDRRKFLEFNKETEYFECFFDWNYESVLL